MSEKKYITKRVLLVFSLFFILKFSLAQNGKVENIREFDPAFEVFELPGGVVGNSVTSIIQDSLGYMWFGSHGGLHRYDGENFITYTSDPINQNTLNSDYIEGIYLDKQGTLWLTHWSGGGVSAYNPDLEIFTRYNNDPDDPESLLPGETVAVIEDSESDIWIGGRQGLSRLDRESGKFKRYSHNPNDPNSLSYDYVRGLYVDKDGTLWVATGMPWDLDDKGGLNRYDAETDSFERFLHNPADSTSISNNKVRAMFEDSRGNFWVGTAGEGLHLFDKANGAFTRYPYDPEDPGKLSMPFLEGVDKSNVNPWSHITSIYEDRDQRLWITAAYQGLNVYDPQLGVSKHFEAGNGENELTSNFVWTTFQSDDGTIWISTAGDGRTVYKVKENEFRFPFFEFPELGDSTKVTRGITKDPNGAIWIAQSPYTPNDPVMESVLWKIDKGLSDISRVQLDPGASSPILSSFLATISLDSSGNLWAGTGDGYFTYSLKEKRLEKFIPDFASPEDIWYAPILQSSTGDIWISYLGHGVIRYDPDKEEYEIFEFDPDKPGSISGPNVWSMFEDEEGTIWMGGGSFTPSIEFPLFLDRFDPESKSFEPFITTWFPSGIVSDLSMDKNRNLWFSDWNYGLFKLNTITREIKQYTSGNSLLPPSRLQTVIPYPGGDIWIATETSIVRMDPINETFSIYNESHGVDYMLGGSRTGYLTPDGELLFARWSGINAFRPDDLLGEIESTLPDLRITGFKLLGDNMSSGLTNREENVLQEPIWKTDLIELNSNENTFAFAVACFDFYQPNLNILQFKLEGYEGGWRSDLRNGETPSYINVAPGKYTFRLRGANGLGVWNTEGISLEIVIYPPWWKTWWAYTLYALIFIGGGVATHKIQRRRVIIKERERAQQKELQQAREIEKAYNKLKEAQQQLIQSEKMASLGELTAGIAHEIQNPLNFVNNFSEVNSELIKEMKEELDKGNLDEVKGLADDIDKNEKKIIHHGKRADSIVKGMLQHSRSGDGNKVLTDLNALADEYVRLAYHGLRARDKSFNAEIKTDFDPDVGKISVVPQELGRVILNLLTNAFYAVDQKKKEGNDGFKPEVRISSRKTQGGVEISVSDNGNGIPEAVREKIFQPFFTTKPTGEGTGLGLSMSYDIITKGHGGDLRVRSEKGKGTTFTITLPGGSV